MTPRRAPSCPICAGDGVLLGTLGALIWFRCRQCGIDFNRPRPKRRRPRARGI